jgi:hypothetical protein
MSEEPLDVERALSDLDDAITERRVLRAQCAMKQRFPRSTVTTIIKTTDPGDWPFCVQIKLDDGRTVTAHGDLARSILDERWSP